MNDFRSGIRTLEYQSGFGNEYATEAMPGALPANQNSPQRAPLGLYAEQISGTPFTAPRAANKRSWLYRMQPSAMHAPFARIADGLWRAAPLLEGEATPNRLRWDALPMESAPADFIDGMATMGGGGSVEEGSGFAVHIYRANRGMTDRYFTNADGELLVVPQLGRLDVHTEMGRLEVAPGEILVLPRGVKFQVKLPDGQARGYVCENYGALLRLPELGPIGSNGLANARDFLAPVAAYEEHRRNVQVVAKFQGHLWATELDHSPLDVVAWHGNYAPYKYDLANFMTINTVSFDHADPSIFTVLTSPSETPGTANLDFVIFPPRWAVAERTFRPPWFHRNYMNEFMGLIRGQYDAKAEGFVPGGASLHNCMSAHGPDAVSFERASVAELKPQYIADTLAFMFETRHVCRPSRFALDTPALQPDYDACWNGFARQFKP